MTDTDNEREPIVDLKTLAEQDKRDMIAGYWAGYGGDGHEPSAEFNRAFWHGWRNGMADSGHMKIDSAMRKLAHAIVEKGKP